MRVIIKEIGTEKRTLYDIVSEVEYRDYGMFRLWMADGSFIDVHNVRQLHRDARIRNCAILDVYSRRRIGF